MFALFAFVVLSDFSRLIPRELRFVKKQLKTITKKLLEREEPCEPAEEACISLPLKTDADVDEIEEKLKASQEFCLQLVRLNQVSRKRMCYFVAP